MRDQVGRREEVEMEKTIATPDLDADGGERRK